MATVAVTINWLFIFIPVAIMLEYGWPGAHTWIFFAACLAIIPIARLIVEGTEHIASRTGDAVGGLLNATFGNAPELIIAVVALRAGLFDMVRASLIGAILANLLLALGVAFLLGGLRYHTQEYNPGATRVYSSMMLIAVISLVVPSTFSRFFSSEATMRQEQLLNLGVAVVLLIAYGLYLLFMLKTHPEFFSAAGDQEERHGERTQWGLPRAGGSLLIASVLAAWMSEILVGAAEGTGKSLGMSQTFIGMVLLAIVGGAAESGSAIAMARKNKIDLTMGIALGSCIQIALFVAPALVLVSYAVAPQPLKLSFGRAEIGSMFLAVLIGAMVSGDGRSNWYKGVQLITVYVIMAFLFYFLPETASR
ncbi:MAG: calcium/proton exchanger [bacterium]|uniref:Ca(2+)/H(+) antiporter n=1 Tax=Candidatus Methylomirabilis tolerans TaxID=3123416 RepID=A0AAJ1AKH3_9BACT|nr:calcium/proton exchanger [Candidatus Methylomirabilis sp.]